jgi:hypothetical protein
MYPKSGRSDNLFSEWIGITKLLDPVMKPLNADEVDYNGGISGLGHRVVEEVMKPTMKKRRLLVVNVWGGGNITKVALISYNPPLLYTPIGWLPKQVAMNFIVLSNMNNSISTMIASSVHFRFSVVSAASRYVQLKRFSHD